MQNERKFFIKEKKTLVLKEKYREKFSIFLTDALAKMFLLFFPFQNILQLFLFQKKTPFLVTARGFPPPPRLRTVP